MTPWAWLACAGAILLLPAPSSLPVRLRRLSAGGRLTAGAADSRSARAAPSVDGPAVIAVAAAVAGALAAVRGVALAAAAVTVVATGGHVVRSALSRRRAARARDELIVALRLLAAELVAGARPAVALGAAADASPRHAEELRGLAAAVESGAVEPSTEEPRAGSGAGPPGSGSGSVAQLVHAWRVCEASGAPLADVVGRLVADLDDARERDRQVSAALAGPRSSAALLAGLPVLGLALGAAMGADPVHVLLDSGPGRVVCAVGAVLDALGVAWTMRIAAGAERG